MHVWLIWGQQMEFLDSKETIIFIYDAIYELNTSFISLAQIVALTDLSFLWQILTSFICFIVFFHDNLEILNTNVNFDGNLEKSMDAVTFRKETSCLMDSYYIDAPYKYRINLVSHFYYTYCV